LVTVEGARPRSPAIPRQLLPLASPREMVSLSFMVKQSSRRTRCRGCMPPWLRIDGCRLLPNIPGDCTHRISLFPKTPDSRCLIPGFDDALFSQEWRDALWDKFYTAAPQRQRRCVEQ